MIAVTIYYFADASGDEFARFFDESVRPFMIDAGADPLACLQTEPSENTFPALAVRTGVKVFVWFARFADRQEYRDHRERLARSTEWTEVVLPEMSKRLMSSPEHLGLVPTARSLLR